MPFFWRPLPQKLPERPRILIVRFSSLGDVVKTTAVPRQIKARYPQAEIYFLTADSFSSLLGHNPHLAGVMAFDRRSGLRGLWQLARSLRKNNFDLVLDLHRSLRSRFLGWLLNAPVLAYSKRSWQRFLLLALRLDSFQPPYGKENDFVAPLARYGIDQQNLQTEIFLPGRPGSGLAPEMARVEACRQSGRPLLGVAAVAAWPLKIWPLDLVKKLLQDYLAQSGGMVLLFGGKGDQARLQAALGELLLQPEIVNLAGRTSLTESAWFAKQCRLVLTNDTGMLHISEAMGRPVIALFGPTSRQLGYFPVRADSLVLEENLACRPCSKNGQGRCRNPSQQACLRGITAERVLNEISKKL